MPCFPLSTGDLPDASPPQGAFTMHPPINADVGQVEAHDLVVGLQADLLQCFEGPSVDPLITASSDRGGRADRVGDPVTDAWGYGIPTGECRCVRGPARRTGPTAVR